VFRRQRSPLKGLESCCRQVSAASATWAVQRRRAQQGHLACWIRTTYLEKIQSMGAWALDHKSARDDCSTHVLLHDSSDCDRLKAGVQSKCFDFFSFLNSKD
jgi:hypothetical protein